jgi:16S rRNA C967 or C1407 C5-methylase (RsmB/RsmF family)/NOL1/NOP2/fmu family ribosome biogenesis protein
MNLDRFLDRSEHDSFERACQKYPNRAIRLRDDRLDRALPFRVARVDWYSRGRWVLPEQGKHSDSEMPVAIGAEGQSVRPASFLNYAVGDYYIQDAGSSLPIALLDPKPGEWICDLCAAPGGKASAILESMSGDGLLVANESIRSRIDVLQFMLSRTGHANYITSSYDPDDLAELLPETFDAILVDAPCSGQMLVGKEKRSTNAWTPSQIDHSAKRQHRILDAAIKLVRPGGRIVYSTCTFAEEENESQMARVHSLYPDCFAPLSAPELSAWSSPVQEGCYRLWPHRDRCAGGFAGGLRRTEKPLDLASASKTKPRRNDQHPRGHHKSERSAIDELHTYGVFGAEVESRLWNSGLYVGSSSVWQLLDRRPWLGIPSLGLYNKGSRWLPSHALALLRRQYFQPNQSQDLSTEVATRFVAGEAIQQATDSMTRIDEPQATGWIVASWQSQSIGWAKSTANRWNNHLPAWAVQNNISQSDL